ncbi:MAG: hypothetical protein GX262_10545 [Clostridia bacterium]|nr:hypothetical protein [Clostridia bacterium]
MSKTGHLLKTIICCLSFFVFLSIPIAQAQQEKQVILLLADYLTIEDLQSHGIYLQNIIRSKTIGLMNTNTGTSSRTSPHTQATISAGQPAHGGNDTVLALHSEEPADGELACTVFRRYTGLVPDDTDIVILNWPQIMRANRNNAASPPLPGSLGSKINEAGLSIAVFGNSDTPRGPHRPGVLIAGNQNGVVSSGNVGEEMLRSSQSLLPWKTDYEKLFSLTVAALASTDFIVVDFGDLYRLEARQQYGLEQIVQEEREIIIKEMEDFYRRLLEAVDLENTLVILASTTPSPAQQKQKNFLVPIIMANNNLESGLLYSNTTRRPGLITNTDLTATILSFLNIEPSPAMTGQPATGVKSTGDPLTYLKDINERMVFTYQVRPSIIKPYIGLQIATILLAIPLFFTLKKLIPFYQFWLGLLVAYPGSLLLVGVFANLGFTAYVILSMLLAMILTVISYRFANRNPIRPFIILSTITAVLITLDLIGGSFFMKQSVLGYDPIAGARFYGIGNEYMGVLIGSSFMGFGVLFQQRKTSALSILAVLYFGSLIWLMFAAVFGANLGGTISLLAAAGYWLWRWHKGFLKDNWLYVLPLMLLFLVMVMMAGVSLNKGNPSHIGRTVQLVQQEGLRELVDIMVRKVQMNLKLIRYTPWSRVFLLALLVIGILFYRPIGFLQRLYYQDRSIYEAFLAILAGSFTALVWNDSGIVAAATAMIFGVYPLLCLALTYPFPNFGS